jgi:hypothetical protein
MMQAIGRVALILAASAFLGLSGAQGAPATTSSGKPDSVGKSTETVGKHRRHAARHHTGKTAENNTTEKSSGDKGAGDQKRVPTAVVPPSGDMPPSVANANAQLAAADTPAAAAANAMSARASDNVQAAADQPAAAPLPDNPAPASDQLSEPDRTVLQDAPPAPKTVGTAAPDPQPRPSPVMASSSSDSSAWEQSSLIGKIFIGFGALLTLASAARMFMA